MKKLLLLFLVALNANGGTIINSYRFAAAGASYLLETDFEGTGTPASWTVQEGSPAFDTSTSGLSLEGSQCLLMGTALSETAASYTAGATRYFYFRFRMSSLPPGDRTDIQVQDASENELGNIYIEPSGTFYAYSGGYSGGSSGQLAINTSYHCWITYSANALYSVAFSTTGIRPTSGSLYQAISGTGVTDANAALFFLKITSGTNWDYYIDDFKVSDTQIGDNP